MTSKTQDVDLQAADLLRQMSLDEKTQQMCGDVAWWAGLLPMVAAYNYRPYVAGENKRLGIDGVRFTDGPRGIVMNHSTCFPVAIARGASWDVELEERIGDAIGVEARALGANFFAGVCINLLRHPAWGRAQETFGEDMHHLGEMGAALVRGVQRHVMACIKHFALNSIENSRFKLDVTVDDRSLYEVYLPHFKRCVDEGAASVMSAYNKVNGEYCGHNARLLRRILKEEWGFDGFVISDFFFGLRDTKAGALGGLDIEMPFYRHFGRRLADAVRAGDIPEALIDEAVLRILRKKLQFAPVGEPQRYTRDAVVSAAHLALARESAQKSIVLLKNDGDLLPIDPARTRRIAVIGHLAKAANTGDIGSSRVRNPYTVTILEGLQDALKASSVELVYHDGKDIAQARQAAMGCDIALVIAGYTRRDEGEYVIIGGGDRDALTLHAHDEALITEISAVNANTAVVMIGGSAIVTEAWRHRARAILMAWYPGMMGGHALADILLGTANPSGKLPCTFPQSAAQLPFFDKKATAITYDYFHGYLLLDKTQEQAAFPFGFGLSYTRYQYSDLRISPESAGVDEDITVSVDITNVGARAGEEVAQLYVGYPDAGVERHVKALKGFQRVAIAPQETRTVTFTLKPAQLAYYAPDARTWEISGGQYTVYVGTSSQDWLQAQFFIAAE